MLAVLEVTQTGTVYVYQGQELGMKNFPRTWGIEEYKDVASKNYWQLCVCSLVCVSPRLSDVERRIKEQRQEKQGRENVDMEDVLDGFQQKARDHARIPMQASPVVLSPTRLFRLHLLLIIRSHYSHVVTMSLARFFPSLCLPRVWYT